MKTCTEIMRSDENVVGSSASVPEWIFGGDEFNCGGDKSACMSNRRESVNGAEVARNVNGNEEEISFVRVKSSNIAFQ